MFRVAVKRPVLALFTLVMVIIALSTSPKVLDRSITVLGSSSIAVKSAIGLSTVGQSLTGVILIVTVTVSP